MNREIKFRAWDKTTKQMSFPENIPTGKNEDATWALMQSTGLKDKNGKEVWEGDILHHKGRNYWVEWLGYKWKLWRDVDLDQPKSGHPFSQIYNHPENFEVIGNIHENNLSEFRHLITR